jgi:hypothetical protein
MPLKTHYQQEINPEKPTSKPLNDQLYQINKDKN